MRFKLLVTDMDGTLLNHEKKITAKTKDALIRCQEEGVRIVMASGRMKPRLEEYAKEIKMDQYGGFIVEANGVALYDYKANEHTDIGWMPRKDAKEVFDWFRMYWSDVEIAVMGTVNVYSFLPKGRNESMYFNDKNPDSKRNREIIPIQDINEVDDQIAKICICDHETTINAVYDSLSVLKDRYWYGRTLPTWLEVGPKHTSKKNAVLKIMDKLHIQSDEVIAFGDGENDLTMLEAFHGVAMANAHNLVKQRISTTTGSCDEDGIAMYLESLRQEEL